MTVPLCDGCYLALLPDEDEDDPGLDADEADMAQIAREWAAYDRDPDGS